jgi:cytidylate kinase
MGSGGSPLGLRVARQLGFAYFDREILNQAAQTLGLEPDDVARYEERASSYWERVMGALAAGGPDATYTPPPPLLPMIFDDRLHEVQKRIIIDLASKFDAVVVGRGGGAILKDHPGVVRVFAYAPLPVRIQAIMEIYHLPTLGRARQVVEASDKDRQRFARSVFSAEWTDARHYDLCLDTASIGFDVAEKMLLDLVRHKAQSLGRPLTAPATPA